MSVSEFLSLPTSGVRKYLLARASMRLPRRRFAARNNAKVERLGKWLSIDRRDLEQAYFEADCVREPENIFLFRAIAKHGLCRRFVDIGANYGHIALKVLPYFEKLTLVDANPNAISFLRRLFADEPKVEIHHFAVVESDQRKAVTLVVPNESSGLARIDNAKQDADGTAVSFECPATTLDLLLEPMGDQSIYIKVDVEGFEVQVLEGGSSLRSSPSVIVGFEAWSRVAAEQCCALFPEHIFYFARLDFVDRSGALTNSWLGLVRAALFGGTISVHRFKSPDEVPYDHFSQIIAVPIALQSRFEEAILAERESLRGVLDLHSI